MGEIELDELVGKRVDVRGSGRGDVTKLSATTLTVIFDKARKAREVRVSNSVAQLLRSRFQAVQHAHATPGI